MKILTGSRFVPGKKQSIYMYVCVYIYIHIYINIYIYKISLIDFQCSLIVNFILFPLILFAGVQRKAVLFLGFLEI